MKLRTRETAGDRLLSVVERRQLKSRSHLAEILGVTSGAIYTAIKRGRITKQMALSVQGALGISAEWLLKGDEPIEAQVEWRPKKNTSMFAFEDEHLLRERLHREYIFASYELYNDPENEELANRLELVKRRLRALTPVIII